MDCPLPTNNTHTCIIMSAKIAHTKIQIILLFGNDEIDINEYSMIFNKVRAYIRQTKRF
jgi:hypothetical protein